MFEYSYTIEGMTCPACAKLIEKRIGKIEGIHSVEVNPKGNATLCAGREISIGEISDVLSDTDYKIS